MVCTFFGKRDAPSSVRGRVRDEINRLIDEGVDLFYVGNNGNFDLPLQSVLLDIGGSRSDFRFFVVLFRLDEGVNVEWRSTLFPEELSSAPPRFAISVRNRWMINNSDIVVTYTNDRFSASFKWREAAKRRGLRIIDLG